MADQKKSSSNLVLKICSNHALYLVNTVAADAGNDGKDGQDGNGGKDGKDGNEDGGEKIMHGSILVGYYKGKWQQASSGDDAKEIKYVLQSSKDYVIFNGQLHSLGNVVSSKRLTTEADTARCCYYEMVDAPEDDDKSAFF